MKRDELIEDVADLVSAYLAYGVEVPDVESVAPDDRIRGIEDLLVRYFVLTGIDDERDEYDPWTEEDPPTVIPFVRKLPGRIKRIKITTEPEIEIGRGEIHGHLDWQETIKARRYRGTQDETLFAFRRTNEHVRSAENLVLATLVDRIYTVVAEQLENARQNREKYQWLREWIDPDSELWKVIKRLKFQNPFISKIEVPDRPVSGPILQEVKTARSPLYREAAKLLERYQRYSRGDYSKSELKELFDSLFVAPEAMDELFELYWGYKLLTPYEERNLESITGESRELARWEEEGAEYRLQFRSTGADPPTFHVRLEDSEAELETIDAEHPDGVTFLQRYRDAVDGAATAKQQLLDKQNVERTFWSGQPDLLLTKRDSDSGKLIEIFVGEVKYTDSNDPSRIVGRASEGLDDLFEYIELLRDGSGTYIASERSSVPVTGAVFTPSFDPEQSVIGNVRVVTYGDSLKRVL